MESFGTIEYMICGLCVLVFCIVFSQAIKKILLAGLKGAAGLLAVKAINTVFAGAGLYVGVNLFNGVLIGVLGLPALIGLYALKLLGY